MGKVGRTLKQNGIKPVKSLGQNFLANDRVIEKIVDKAGIDKEDCVLEIGAGIGNLTYSLAERCGMVIAVEIDKKLIPILKDAVRDFTNTVIINDDILNIDIGKTMDVHVNEALRLKVVANLPYYITTPVIMKILEENPRIDSMTIMVQKEVADRLTARSGSKDYGALTASVGYYTHPEKIMNVSPGCFIPPPDVNSSVVRMNMTGKPAVDVKDTEIYFKTVKAAFGQRRKMLVNALYNSGSFIMSKEEIIQRVINAGISPSCRGEELSVVQFAKLADSFFVKKA